MFRRGRSQVVQQVGSTAAPRAVETKPGQPQDGASLGSGSVGNIFNIVPTWIPQGFVDPPGRAVGGKYQDGAAMGSGRVKHIFNIVPTLARLSVRKISETTKREGKTERKTYETKREGNQRARHVFQKKENLKAAPLPPSLDGAGQNQAPRGPQ